LNAAGALPARERRLLTVARWAAVATMVGALLSPPLANAAAFVLLASFALLPSAGPRLQVALALPLVRAALLLLAVLAVATLWADAPAALRWKYWWDWRTLLLLIVGLALFDDEAARRRAVLAFVAAAVLICGWSFWAWWQGFSPAGMDHGLPGIVARNSTTQGMAFAAACFLALTLAVGDRGLDRRLRLPLLAGAALLACNLAFVTSSRSGHLMLLILLAGTVVQLLEGWRRIAAIAALPLAAALVFGLSPMLQARFGAMVSELRTPLASEQMSGMGIRVVMWDVSAQMVRERPLLGYGTGGFPAAYESAIKRSSYRGWAATPTIDPHSQYLLVQLQAGIAGSAAFAWFLLAGFRARGPNPWRAAGKALLLGWCASALATSVFTAFAESHLLMPLLGILLAPAAVTAVARTGGLPAAGAPPPPPR
jgi:O-antigen ligase